MSSIFDPNTFAQLTVTEANATESVPVPTGEWPATIKDKKILTWEARDKSSAGMKINISWEVTDPAVVEVTGRESNLVKQEFMFDLTETGGLDMGKGKNVRLGRLREAVDLNVPGEPFTFDMLNGRQALIVVGHRADTRDPNILYAEVKDVAKL